MFERIKMELLDKESAACLPRNLSNEWLEYLAQSAEKMLEGDEGESDAIRKEASLAVVVRLLDAKSPGRAAVIEVPIEGLYQYVQRFRMELALEQVHRNTDVKYEPATLETILTEREVKTWREAI